MNTKRHSRGQALVETGLVVPILLLLLFGAFNVGALISDKLIVSAAARAGARLGAGLGGASRSDAGTATATVDADIVGNVLIAAKAVNYGTVTKITIYKPSRADGAYTAGDPADIYDGSGNLQGSRGYPLTARLQIPPNQTPIGVKVDWTYKTPLPQPSFNLSASEYVVMQMSPVEN